MHRRIASVALFASLLLPSLALYLLLSATVATAKAGAAVGGGPIYVDQAATGLNNGTSWTDAFTSLQSGLVAAGAGSEIWVAAGVYKPTVPATRTASFQLKTGVSIYGGFQGTEVTRDQRDPNPLTNGTILSGDRNGDDGAGNRTDNVYHVVTGRSLTTTDVVLDGFTIRGGQADGMSNIRGAGVNLGDSTAVTLANLLIQDNIAIGNGGGLYNRSSSPLLINVIFRDNIGDDGGGMFNFSKSSPTLVNVAFTNNGAQDDGGAIGNGTGSQPTLINVTINANWASMGGGIHSIASSGPTLTNVIIWDNMDVSGTGTFTASLFTSATSTPTISYSLIQAHNPIGIGNLDGTMPGNAPLFMQPASTMIVGDLRLQVGSPAADVGDNATLPLDTADLDEDGDVAETLPLDLAYAPRVVSVTVDMGAYEGQFFHLAIAAGPAQSIDLSWNYLGTTCTYALYESTAPYFAPPGEGVVVFSGDAGGANLPGKAGDPATNYFYRLHPGGTSCPGATSNEVGVFDFAITPGDPPPP